MTTPSQLEPQAVTITDGPSSAMLCAALAGGDALTVTFEGKPVQIKVVSLMIESGSRTKWFVRGHLTAKGSAYIDWYYDAQYRRGYANTAKA
jgi:hypothetical protein